MKVQTVKSGKIYKDFPMFISVFILAELMMLYILKNNGFYPFGTKSMLIMDMKNQYVEFITSLRNIIRGEDSIFFSWSRSMGGNYIGVFAYYIASPFSFLTLLFSVEKMPVAIEFLTCLKIGLCGISFCIYAKYLFDKYNAKSKILNICLIIPSICYAFMSYTMVYSLSIMWLDAVIFLPLILMGLEKIFDGSKGLQYVLCLTLLFISNYYTGYMVAIFTGLYFIIKIVSQYDISKRNIKKELSILIHFIMTSLMSVALAAPLLLASLKDLMSGKLSDIYTGYEPAESTNFVFAKIFTKFLYGKYDSITNTGLPAIYCGFVIIIFAALFFFMKNINIREKIGMILLICLFLLSFYFVGLDKVWHGFQYPNWFPYRYAFLFSFTLIYMALRTLISIDLSQAKLKMHLLEIIPNYVYKMAAFIIIVGVLIEMANNGAILIKGLGNEFGYGEMEEYTSFIRKTKPLVDGIKKNDNDLYRVNQRYDYSKNDAMLLGYHGMTHYSSAFNAYINNLIPKLGLGQSYFWNSGYSSTPLTDSIFGCKYTISDETMPASCYTQLDTTAEGGSSYKNDMALPFAYAVSDKCTEPDLNQPGIFANQNNYLSSVTGTTVNYFTGCQFSVKQDTANTWTYSIQAVSDNPMYLYMQSNAGYADVYVNNNRISDYFSERKTGALYLGDFTTGQTVTVQVVAADDGNTYSQTFTDIVQLDVAALKNTTASLQKHGLKIKKQNGNSISGEIILDNGQNQIMTSIPYDEGWTIYIDGEKTDYTKYAGSFIKFDCSSGKHTITMKYVSPGFYQGVIVGIIGLLAFAFVFILHPMRKSRENKIAMTL